MNKTGCCAKCGKRKSPRAKVCAKCNREHQARILVHLFRRIPGGGMVPSLGRVVGDNA